MSKNLSETLSSFIQRDDEYELGLRKGKAELAGEVLAVLRCLRDEAQEEYDALIKAKGEIVCTLWDRLRELEKLGES